MDERSQVKRIQESLIHSCLHSSFLKTSFHGIECLPCVWKLVVQ